MSDVILTKLAIENLASVLKGMEHIGLDVPLAIKTIPQSGRPYVELGAPDEYGKYPRLVVDDVGMWGRGMHL